MLYDHSKFLKLFRKTQRAGRIDASMPPPLKFADMTRTIAELIIPNMPSESNPPAFFFPPEDTIFVNLGEVSAGLVVHEMCHAYTSVEWRAMYVRLSNYNEIQTEMGRLAEGVASELADMVVATWSPPPGFGAGVSSGIGHYVRRSDVPSAYGGYSHKYKAMAVALMSLVPPVAVAAAVFGGAFVLDIDRRDVARSRLRFGRVIVALDAMFRLAADKEAYYERAYGP